MKINSFDTNSINQLLNSASGSGKNNSVDMSGIYGNLSELASVKSGSYGKLVKSYIAKDDKVTKGSSSDKTNSKKDKTDEKTTNEKRLAKIETNAKSVAESAKALYQRSKLWSKDSEGNYDTDKIYDAVNKFVSDYNATIKSAADSEESSVAKSAASMVNTNTSNIKLLNKIGISLDEKTYQLSIDKEAFKKADMNNIKTLFSGTGSYAYQMAAKASMLANDADYESKRQSTYTDQGTYQAPSTGSLYDSLF